MKNKLRVSILGVNGYTGFELVRMLSSHSDVELKHLAVRQEPLPKISDLFPALRGICDLRCSALNIPDIAAESDILFSALPHTVSMSYIPECLSVNPGLKIIDLSADYRLENAAVYEAAYAAKHADAGRLSEFVYGLPEHHRARIAEAQLVANPGCFPTGIQLALMPALKHQLIDVKSIIIDSKTGVSGGGRQPRAAFHFPEINENMHAYKVAEHQHQPEIEQELSRMAEETVETVFVPHLIPVTRGILNTIYVKLKENSAEENLRNIYAEFYDKERFLRILPAGETPRISAVNYSNFCDVAMKLSGQTLILMSAIDNLIKGAAGQAIQNMNIMAALPETRGLLNQEQ